ncbi:MAG: chloride channel protein [Acidobacteriota bacterium]
MAEAAARLLRSLATALLAVSSSALLLCALDRAGEWFAGHRALVLLLPAAGWLTQWLYRRSGAGGMAEVLADIADPLQRVSWKMAPAVLSGTLLTHVCGGSAGREGTAVQAGAACAARAGADLRIGIAAGFGSVFGTPWAGLLYACEISGLRTAAPALLAHCLLAACTADAVARAWGAQHTVYRIARWPGADALLWAAAAGLLCGGAAWLFHLLTNLARRYLSVLTGGAVVAAALATTGAWQFAGLGVASIAAAFTTPAGPFDWLAKLALTAVTVGSGFRGGEATPLFFIGATLGSALSGPLGLPADWLAGLGFVAVFAAATRTPLASTVLAVELFGPSAVPYALAACFSADRAAALAQRLWRRGEPKTNGLGP